MVTDYHIILWLLVQILPKYSCILRRYSVFLASVPIHFCDFIAKMVKLSTYLKDHFHG